MQNDIPPRNSQGRVVFSLEKIFFRGSLPTTPTTAPQRSRYATRLLDALHAAAPRQHGMVH